jgi:nitroreductase
VLQALFEAAGAAPDHGQLRPWRFVLVPQHKRSVLAAAFEEALVERDPAATVEQRANARDKAFRAPVLVLAIARMDSGGMPASTTTGTRVHDHERLVALGCALQNILLMAHAHGFGAGLTSGQAMQSDALRRLFSLAAHEHAVCCINIGTVSKHKQRTERAPLGAAFSTL